VSDLTEVFGTQNVHDDDGQVIDSLFIEVDDAPDLKPAAETVYPPAEEQKRKTTRILSTSQIVTPIMTPILFLPEDANRRGVTIQVFSLTAVGGDGVQIASDLGLLSISPVLTHANPRITDALMEHTGPIYIQPASLGATGIGVLSAPVLVQAWAVTL
jgi:hypothetical protein